MYVLMIKVLCVDTELNHSTISHEKEIVASLTGGMMVADYWRGRKQMELAEKVMRSL